jgi:hypothetical protein
MDCTHRHRFLCITGGRVSQLADVERTTLRAIRYWSGRGLLICHAGCSTEVGSKHANGLAGGRRNRSHIYRARRLLCGHRTPRRTGVRVMDRELAVCDEPDSFCPIAHPCCASNKPPGKTGKRAILFSGTDSGNVAAGRSLPLANPALVLDPCVCPCAGARDILVHSKIRTTRREAPGLVGNEARGCVWSVACIRLSLQTLSGHQLGTEFRNSGSGPHEFNTTPVSPPAASSTCDVPTTTGQDIAARNPQ